MSSKGANNASNKDRYDLDLPYHKPSLQAGHRLLVDGQGKIFIEKIQNKVHIDINETVQQGVLNNIVQECFDHHQDICELMELGVMAGRLSLSREDWFYLNKFVLNNREKIRLYNLCIYPDIKDIMLHDALDMSDNITDLIAIFNLVFPSHLADLARVDGVNIYFKAGDISKYRGKILNDVVCKIKEYIHFEMMNTNDANYFIHLYNYFCDDLPEMEGFLDHEYLALVLGACRFATSREELMASGKVALNEYILTENKVILKNLMLVYKQAIHHSHSYLDCLQDDFFDFDKAVGHQGIGCIAFKQAIDLAADDIEKQYDIYKIARYRNYPSICDKLAYNVSKYLF